MVLVPVELEMEGFRSFTENTLIRFPSQRKGTILISGKYKDKTTSSGSGKSTIPLALSFCLGFCDVPNTELKSWYTKKMKVRLRLTDGSNTYDIIRSPKLSIIENDVPYAGTSAGAEARLVEILGLPTNIVKVLTYRPQRTPGTFLSSNDGKLKDFLTEVVGLGEIEDSLDFFAEEMKSLTSKVDTITARIEQANASLPALAVDGHSLMEAEDQLSMAEKAVSAIQSTGEAELEIKKSLSVAAAAIKSIDDDIYKISSATSLHDRSLRENASIKTNILSIQDEINVLESGVCSTCKQEWNKSQDLILSKKGRISNLLVTMKENVAVIKNALPLIDPKHKDSLVSERASLLTTQSTLHADLGKLSAPLSGAVRERDMARSMLDSLIRQGKSHDAAVNNIENMTSELEATNVDLSIVSHCCRLLDRQGFLGVIFDELLLNIKNKTNEMMAPIPNVNTFTFDISSDSVTQKGKVNKKIKKTVNKDGIARSVKAMSGGQIASVELCVDLAMSSTIKERTGSNLGWVALDEAMDGLDVETKSIFLETIRSSADGLVFVVDHSTEIKESFDMVINIEYDGKNSYVV